MVNFVNRLPPAEHQEKVVCLLQAGVPVCYGSDKVPARMPSKRVDVTNPEHDGNAVY
jgi:hypothetical protein